MRVDLLRIELSTQMTTRMTGSNRQRIRGHSRFMVATKVEHMIPTTVEEVVAVEDVVMDVANFQVVRISIVSLEAGNLAEISETSKSQVVAVDAMNIRAGKIIAQSLVETFRATETEVLEL